MPSDTSFTRATWPLLLLALTALPLLAAPLELHVAPGGTGDGSSQAKALPSLTAARDRLRELRAANQLGDGATVLVHPGRYVLSETLAFTADDAGTEQAPIVYRGVGNDLPILCGGPVVTGFKPYQGKILQADLKALGLGGASFGQLFFSGRRMTLARVPNDDPTDIHGGVWAHVVEAATKDSKNSFIYAKKEVDASGWVHPEEARIGVFCNFDWRWNRLPVKTVEPNQLRIDLGRDATYPLCIGDRYFVENVFEELDAPGEWYLDRRTSTLYFYPPEPLANGEVTVPTVGTLVDLKETHDLRLEGFILEGCDDNALSVTDSERCRVGRSILRNCGGWGATLSGGSDCSLAGCDISNTGKGGVSVSGGDRLTLTPARNEVTNCYIHHVAVFEKTYNTGINVGGVGNLATHNLIHDTPHAAMTVAGNDNVIEFNHVHHTNLQSTDTGGIYSCPRDWTQRGNIIRYNLWHDIGGFGKRSSWQPVQNGKVEFEYPHFTWGIYMDDPTSGNLIYGNILYRVPVCALHNHGGRDNVWENNIIVDCPAFQAGMLSPTWTAWPQIQDKFRDVTKPGSPYFKSYPILSDYQIEQRPEAMSGLKFIHNIVYYTQAGTAWNREHKISGCDPETMRLYTLTCGEADFATNDYNDNVIYAEPGIGLKIELTARPQPHETLDWAGWQAKGKDTRSVLADPLFVDAANHDYRLKPNSPALKLGFKPIPTDQIGPFQDPLRVSWPVKIAPHADDVPQPVRRFFEIPGMEPVPAQAVTARDGLPNVLAKLKAGGEVKIAYYGGGIHGVGSGWWKALTDHLSKAYPKAKLTTINGGVCDCCRGSSFSVYRYRHDVLDHQPDLVIVDFASDDLTTSYRDIHRAIEGAARQTWTDTPTTDLLFVYAYRQGMEEAYAEGQSPAVVNAYEHLANRYGIPALNMGYAVAQRVQAGEELKKYLGDGTRPTGEGNATYGAALVAGWDAIAALDTQAKPHTLPRPMTDDNLEQARQVAITKDMLSGNWRQLGDEFTEWPRFSRYFDALWYTDEPGAKLTFRFKGTSAALLDLMGPDTGRVQVSIDGKVVGIRQQVDPWAYYQRLATIPIGGGLEDTEHTVVVELLPDAPDRQVAIEGAKNANRYDAKLFEGVALRLGFIRIVGEPMP